MNQVEQMMRASRILWAAFAFVAMVPESLWAQGGAEGGGGLFDINAGLSAWTLIVFFGLLAILGRYAWAPILQAVDIRVEWPWVRRRLKRM